MRRLWWVLLFSALVPALRAQTPPDTSDEAEAQQLRQEIREQRRAAGGKVGPRAGGARPRLAKPPRRRP